MEIITNYGIPALVLLALLFVIYLAIRISSSALLQSSNRAVLKERGIEINEQLLEAGMAENKIMSFWEDCLAEAEIRHHLPPCRCKDVNQCETWCQTKSRFVLHPPEEGKF